LLPIVALSIIGILVAPIIATTFNLSTQTMIIAGVVLTVGMPVLMLLVPLLRRKNKTD
jgi:predicted signal transduction protein with EAL and GGDEF domain